MKYYNKTRFGGGNYEFRLEYIEFEVTLKPPSWVLGTRLAYKIQRN